MRWVFGNDFEKFNDTFENIFHINVLIFNQGLFFYSGLIF